MAVRRYRPINYPTTVTETNDLTAAVTWANVPDANITESSVTQHAAAIGGALVLDDISDVTETTITTGDLLRWNGSAWVNYPDSNFQAAGSFLSNVVEDTTPQLGGNLDLNSQTINGTGTIGITGAITATSYGGITEANLVDKSAAETITGAWALPSTATIDSITATNLLDKSAAESISGAYTFSGAGVFSTSLNAVPLARSVTATGNTASTDYGIVIRFTSGSAQTFTLDGDPPTNAVVLLDNSAGAAWTIAASTSLIWAKDASTGNRTLADDGVAVAVHRGSGTWIINGSDLLT